MKPSVTTLPSTSSGVLLGPLPYCVLMWSAFGIGAA